MRYFVVIFLQYTVNLHHHKQLILYTGGVKKFITVNKYVMRNRLNLLQGTNKILISRVSLMCNGVNQESATIYSS